jgi:hypothetical protein
LMFAGSDGDGQDESTRHEIELSLYLPLLRKTLFRSYNTLIENPEPRYKYLN